MPIQELSFDDMIRAQLRGSGSSQRAAGGEARDKAAKMMNARKGKPWPYVSSAYKEEKPKSASAKKSDSGKKPARTGAKSDTKAGIDASLPDEMAAPGMRPTDEGGLPGWLLPLIGGPAAYAFYRMFRGNNAPTSRVPNTPVADAPEQAVTSPDGNRLPAIADPGIEGEVVTDPREQAIIDAITGGPRMGELPAPDIDPTRMLPPGTGTIYSPPGGFAPPEVPPAALPKPRYRVPYRY